MKACAKPIETIEIKKGKETLIVNLADYEAEDSQWQKDGWEPAKKKKKAAEKTETAGGDGAAAGGGN